MALSTSPRKLTVPLATGDEPRARQSNSPSITKRVFYAGVVIEGSENGRRLPDEIQDLVLSFGEPLQTESSADPLAPSTSNPSNPTLRKRALTDSSALASAIEEFLQTERNYVTRLEILKNDYADPLRSFARNKDTVLIAAYEAKTIFGNIDNLLPVNQAFLRDLEDVVSREGVLTPGDVGDICLKHFKELKGFEQYRLYYNKREEAQAIFEREVSKKSSRFASYIERIKYQTADPKHRVNLRDLLIEPIQRIPRYTLLFRTMMKHMLPDDPQRAKIAEADEIASKIAQAEIDEQTKRAAVFASLMATIDGFPSDLFSSSRKFVDCIDVEDIIPDSASSTNAPVHSLHCTLILFDDKLVIVKRPSAEKSGRALTGLNNIEKLAKNAGVAGVRRKTGMSCKGVVDITEVVATDVSGADVHLYLENPPMDQTERWNGRPFRAMCVVDPPSPINFDPIQTEADKQRFLNNLWNVQATYRARLGQSVVLCANEQEVDCRAGRVTLARTYYNVYQRTAFLQEAKKTKVVVHIDPMGTADPLPFGTGGPPHVVIRIQPMAGALCRYNVSSSDPSDAGEEDIVQTERVPSRIVQTIHQFGLFEFKTGKSSLPSTPTHRHKVAIFGLDAISRNLFNSRPASAMGDFFSGSINGHKRNRSRSTASRSSMYTQSTSTQTNTTNDSLTKFTTYRSNSTHATTVSGSGMDDDGFFSSSHTQTRSSKNSKLSKSSKSRAADTSDSEGGESLRSHSRASSRATEPEYSDVEDDTNTILAGVRDSGTSDYNLALQLELARQNSLSQKQVGNLQIEAPVESTIYEEDPPPPVRPSSRASRSGSPTKRPESPPRTARPMSIHSTGERRVMGPRSPSPLPPTKVGRPRSQTVDSWATDEDDDDYQDIPQPRRPSQPARGQSSIPRRASNNSNHRRQQQQQQQQSLFPSASVPEEGFTTPKASHNRGASSSSVVTPLTATPIEPLLIKKKTSNARSAIFGAAAGVASTSPTSASSNVNFLNPSPSSARRPHSRNSPLNRRVVSPRRVSPSIKKLRPPQAPKDPLKSEDLSRMHQLARSTKEEMESSQRAMRSIKAEVDTIAQLGVNTTAPSSSRAEEIYTSSSSRPPSPEKALRTPQPNQAMTKAAQERLEEMRSLIGLRQGPGGELTPKSTKLRASIFEAPSRASPAAASTSGHHRQQSSTSSKNISTLVAEAEESLSRAMANQEALQAEMERLIADLKERTAQAERAKLDLASSKRQCELVKSLLADATAEKEIMYDAFNEELDGMFNDANLPTDEAWVALSTNLRNTKEARNKLSHENAELKQKLAECELQREEWGDLLRLHGLIS